MSNSQLLSQVVEVDSVVESADPVEFTAPEMSDADLVPPSDTLGEYIEVNTDLLYNIQYHYIHSVYAGRCSELIVIEFLF